MQPIFIMGPTAVGKTAVALELARQVDGEIVSADSMQVYRGMDIGTAKPTAAEQARVPHHLIDICEVTETFDVKRFTDLAVATVRSIAANGHTPLVVGGSGLYLRALRHGVFDGPARDRDLRARLELLTADTLFAELERVDPQTAATIDRQNPRRLVRALEVFYATGQPISAQQTEWPEKRTGPGQPDLSCCPAFCLDRERRDLHERIERRIEQQLAAGWLDEVRMLLAGLEQAGGVGRPADCTALQAAGYRQLAAYVAGELGWDETVDQVKARTRQLARRQITWFRRETGVTWLQIKPDEAPVRTAQRIRSLLPA